MKLYHWKGSYGNFGDDLNEVLWPALAPELFAEDDGILFVGIGTILDRGLPAAPLRVVFGSGAGYDPLPPDLDGPGWQVRCVRGPLTAQLLGCPERLAITDPAVLTRVLWPDASHDGSGVVFVPHWRTAALGIWNEVCAGAEVGFLDPRGDVETVVRRIASAKLVLAECATRSDPGRCFSRALGCRLHDEERAEFQVGGLVQLDGRSLRAHNAPGADDAPGNPGAENASARRVAGELSNSGQALEIHTRRMRQLTAQAQHDRANGPRPFKSRVVDALDLPSFRPVTRVVDRILRDRTAKALRHAHALEPSLSSDERLSAVIADLLERLDELRQDHRAGTLQPSRTLASVV